MLLEEKQKFFDLYKKRHVFGEPPKSSWGLRDCPYFVVHCMALGTLGGFYGGGMKNIWDLRKTHTTLLQDLAAPKRTKFTPKPFVLGRYVSKTAVLFGYAARGTLHGAVYGATNCYLRQGLQTSDRTSVFISGLVGTGIGGFLWGGRNLWWTYGLIFTLFTTALTFDNEFLMIRDANITSEQERRAKKRLDEQNEFMKECLNRDALYKAEYKHYHPEEPRFKTY